MSHDIMENVRITQRLLEEEQSFVTVTLLDIRGSAPQVVGAKAIVTEDGLAAGTVGGGKIEATAISHARKLLAEADETTDLVTWNLQTEIGMTCGGEVKLFFEVQKTASWPIAIFGAGHVAQRLIPLLSQLNCRLFCFDSRSDWLAKIVDDPKVNKRCTDSPTEFVDELPENTFFVLMSKGHATDLPVLSHILTTRNAPYVGVIGSKQKATALRRDLSGKIPIEKLDSFYCPIGLPFGNNTTAEIAISVAAQLISIRDEIGVLKHPKKSF